MKSQPSLRNGRENKGFLDFRVNHQNSERAVAQQFQIALGTASAVSYGVGLLVAEAAHCHYEGIVILGWWFFYH